MAFKDYRKESRINWGSDQEKALTHEQINTGCLLRIADSVESMSVNHVKLQGDYNYMRKRRDALYEENEKLKKSIVGLKGVIGKLKKKLSNQNTK